MKNKWVWIIVAILIVVAIALKVFVPDDKEVEKPLNINVGDEFTAFDYDKPKYVLNYKIADYTGNGINDMAILIGEKEANESVESSNIDIILYSAENNIYYRANLKKFNGKMAKIENADVTGDGILDIISIVQNEDNTYNLRIVKLEGNELKEIFKDKNNKGLYFTVKFLDGFKINIINRKLNIDNTFDISEQKEMLVNQGIFEESGKVIDKNARGTTTGFVSVEQVQLSNCVGLKTTQRIVVVNNINIIDEISIIWKYEDGKWQIKEATSLKQGNLLY